jgi:hypothetical protein
MTSCDAVPNAERTALSRARRRRGARLAPNVEFTAAVVEFLLVNGYLHPDDVDFSAEVGAAITAFMADTAGAKQ